MGGSREGAARPAGVASRILASGPFRDRFYFQNPLHRENIEQAIEGLGDLSRATVLDYGCGARVLTTDLLARASSRVVAVDADFQALRLLRERLPPETRGRVLAVVSDAHALALVAESVDAVFGLGVLHHLDLARAVPALARVMRPGSRGAFVEPLGHNPFLRLFRLLTPGMRERDEHPLLMRDLRAMAGSFTRFDHHESQLFSLGALALRALPWVGERLYRLSIRPLAAADRILLKRIPWLRRHTWTTVITLTRGAGAGTPPEVRSPDRS